MKDSVPSITIVGSFMTDLMSRTPRMPVPGETVCGGPFKMGPGGKGSNQAVAAARLGAKVQVIVRLGTDIFGDQALENLIKERVDTTYVIRDSKSHTGAALIAVDDTGENMIIIAPGVNNNLSVNDVKHAKEAIYNSDVLLTQLEIPLESVDAALRIAKSHNVNTILNPAPARKLIRDMLSQVDILTPNRTEAGMLTEINISDEATAKKAAYKLINEGVGAVVFTLGKEGTLIVTTDKVQRIPGKKVKVVDTTGAGDAFNGGLAFALAKKEDLAEAVRFANYVAALSVTKIGTAPSMPTFQEVERFMKISQ